MNTSTDTEVRRAVSELYAKIPATTGGIDDGSHKRVAQAFGYSVEELDAIPRESNMGLSCGNPTAVAGLKEGETVVDLGSGGGLDVFLAARKVGPTGKAIGIDMTMAMIDLSRRNAQKSNLQNVEFRLGEIEHMPLPSNTADCVISNCVINLCPNKEIACREIYRITKPGGRLAISDIALKKPLPADVANDILAYAGCIAGAIQISEYVGVLQNAGFKDVMVIESKSDLNVYLEEGDCCGGVNNAVCGPAQPQVKAKVEEACCTPAPAGSSACCTPKEKKEVKEDCCTPAPAGSSACCTPKETKKEKVENEDRTKLFQFMKKYDINEFADSVKIFATKPAV